MARPKLKSIPHPSGKQLLNAFKILLWTIIAVSLLKFAFFPASNKDDDSALNPEATYGQMTTTVSKGTIKNALSLEGTIQADTASTVKATLDGEVTEIYVNDGDQVEAGQSILLLQKQEQGEDTQTTDPATGQPVITPGKPYWVSEEVTAPAAGKLKLDAIMKQQFTVGAAVGTVQPSSFSAVAALTPDQMYRVDQVPEAATITVKNGPAPFDCHGLHIETPQGQTTGDSAAAGAAAPAATGSSSTKIEAKCAIPGDQKVFPGLQVTMDLVAGEATDVLTLPISAVEGRFQTGYVYKPNADPTKDPEKIKVTLGISDGKRVEVKEGLKDGQEVLEFIPGQEETEMQCNPNTGEGC